MMKRILKYNITSTGPTVIDIPPGSQYLSIQLHGDRTYLWAIVEYGAAASPHQLTGYGAYEELPEDFGTYLGTVQYAKGMVEYHYFIKEIK